MTHTEELAAAFIDGLTGLDEVEVSADLLDEARRAGRRVVAAGRWSRLAGERLDTAAVRALLGITRQALHQRVTAGTILAVPGTTTTWFPAWQFHRPAAGAGIAARPVVAEVIGTFRERLGRDVSALTLVGWAATAQPELDGATPQEWVAADGDDTPVLLAAARAAAALAR